MMRATSAVPKSLLVRARVSLAEDQVHHLLAVPPTRFEILGEPFEEDSPLACRARDLRDPTVDDEAAQRRQPAVSGGDADLPVSFQMLEKGEDLLGRGQLDHGPAGSVVHPLVGQDTVPLDAEEPLATIASKVIALATRQDTGCAAEVPFWAA